MLYLNAFAQNQLHYISAITCIYSKATKHCFGNIKIIKRVKENAVFISLINNYITIQSEFNFLEDQVDFEAFVNATIASVSGTTATSASSASATATATSSTKPTDVLFSLFVFNYKIKHKSIPIFK